jgi:hypothetical protein
VSEVGYGRMFAWVVEGEGHVLLMDEDHGFSRPIL